MFVAEHGSAAHNPAEWQMRWRCCGTSLRYRCGRLGDRAVRRPAREVGVELQNLPIFSWRTARLVRRGRTTSSTFRARNRLAGCVPGNVSVIHDVGVRDQSVTRNRRLRGRILPFPRGTPRRDPAMPFPLHDLRAHRSPWCGSLTVATSADFFVTPGSCGLYAEARLTEGDSP